MPFCIAEKTGTIKMSRWHRVSCNAPKVFIQDGALHCSACSSSASNFNSQAVGGGSISIPPSEAPGQPLNLSWPHCVPWAGSDTETAGTDAASSSHATQSGTGSGDAESEARTAPAPALATSPVYERESPGPGRISSDLSPPGGRRQRQRTHPHDARDILGRRLSGVRDGIVHLGRGERRHDTVQGRLYRPVLGRPAADEKLLVSSAIPSATARHPACLGRRHLHQLGRLC